MGSGKGQSKRVSAATVPIPTSAPLIEVKDELPLTFLETKEHDKRDFPQVNQRLRVNTIEESRELYSGFVFLDHHPLYLDDQNMREHEENKDRKLLLIDNENGDATHYDADLMNKLFTIVGYQANKLNNSKDKKHFSASIIGEGAYGKEQMAITLREIKTKDYKGLAAIVSINRFKEDAVQTSSYSLGDKNKSIISSFSHKNPIAIIDPAALDNAAKLIDLMPERYKETASEIETRLKKAAGPNHPGKQINANVNF